MKVTRNIDTGYEKQTIRTISTKPKEHFEGRWKSGRLYPLYSVVVNNGTTFISQNAKMKEEPYVIYDADKKEFKAPDGWLIKEMSADSRVTALGGGGEGGVTPDEVEEMIKDKVDKVDGKGLSTNDYDNTEKDKVASAYQKPASGIPASDIASGVIPTVPTISTDVSADAASDVKTSSPKSVKTYVDAGIAAVESDLADLADEVEAIDIGAYVVAWDGESAPVVANIPAGVVVTYGGADYTGTLAASASTIQKIYLVATGTTDNYDRYITVGDSTYSWVNLGTTEIPLEDYATEAEVSQLEHEVTPVAIPITATGKYIKTDGDIGTTLPSPTTSTNYRYMRLAVVPGDTLLVTAHGGSSPRIWCFVDSDNKILSHANNLTGVVSVTLTAPANAAAVIINDKNSGNTSYYISKDTLLYKVRGINVVTANNNGFIKNTVTGGDGVSKDIITKVSGTNIYVPDADISQIAIYENCVKEVWVNPKTLTGINRISLSKYGSYVYLYGKTGVDSSATWTARKDITNESDNVIIPIPVTSAGGSANLGDIAGYVVFSDIATFRSNSYSGTKAFINKDRAISLDYNRDIWYGIMQTSETIGAEIANAMAGGLEIVLPSVIYAAVGVQLNIYNDTIALSMDRGLDSPLNYIVRWNCSKGVVTNRCFRWTPKATDVGNTTITCYVYTTAGVLIASKSATIKVVSGSIDSAKNVLFVGDSTGADSAAALYADFANASMYSGVAPVFVGSKGTTPKHEAFGGARWADFATEGRAAYRCQVSGVGPIALNSQYTNNGFTWTVVEVNVTDGVGNILITKFSLASNQDAPEANGVLVPTGGGDSIPYTDATRAPGNPFWHDGAIDFSHYRSTIGLEGKIDAIIFLLGLNGDEALDDTEQYINDLYAAAVADNEDCIVIVGLITGPANTVDAYGVDYGAGNWLNMVKKFHNRRKLYVEMAEGGDYPNMRIAPTNFYIDRYYGYRLGTRAVSARNATTETYHTNYVHPASSGYAQIGDALFPAVIATMNE